MNPEVAVRVSHKDHIPLRDLRDRVQRRDQSAPPPAFRIAAVDARHPEQTDLEQIVTVVDCDTRDHGACDRVELLADAFDFAEKNLFE